ncbi:MAG TPA: extracellular solute-binding protein [Acetobacteraceae bacterium]|nr:extracellular solute-binding protein [Acetobacteraceae bacterium]
MNTNFTMTRRAALKTAVAGAALPLVNLRAAHAATTLKVGLWDHWVPGANPVLKKQIDDWGQKNNVTVEVDFITSNGNKLQLTGAAEAQAGIGHDIMTFATWDVHNYSDKLLNVDDVIKELESNGGPFNKVATYLAKGKSGWAAVPTTWGSQTKPCCARISLIKQYIGVDVTQMYPPREVNEAGKTWTWDGDFFKAAEAASKAGEAFGLGLGQTSDSVDWVGALFAAYGAELVDKDGKPQVNSDAMHAVLDYAQKLVPFLPADAVSYDDASNNRALISGKSALIMNPPSAWAVAKKDAPQIAADCWTFPNPAGPKGRYIPYLGFFWGIWKFSKNQQPAKELIEYLMSRPVVEAREPATMGYDLPPQNSMMNFDVWSQVEPPKGTVFNYPMRPWFNAEFSIAAAPAPAEIAVQIYNAAVGPTMLAKLKGGSAIKDVISWADNQVQGFIQP